MSLSSEIASARIELVYANGLTAIYELDTEDSPINVAFRDTADIHEVAGEIVAGDRRTLELELHGRGPLQPAWTNRTAESEVPA